MIYPLIETIFAAVGFLVYISYRNDIRKAYERIGTGNEVIHTACWSFQYTEFGAGVPMLIVHGADGWNAQGKYIAKLIGGNYRWIAPSHFGYLGSLVPDGANLSIFRCRPS